MQPEEIHTALLSHGLNYRRIADILDVSNSAVANTVKRLASSHRIATAIATAIDKPIEDVFPDVPTYHRPYYPPYGSDLAQQRLGEKLKAMNLTGA